jgi:hypothetical protein
MAMAQRASGSLLRRFLGLSPPTSQRALSTSAAPAAAAPAAAAAEGEAAKAKRAKKKNLFDVVQFLPDWGVGYKVAKTTWRDVSYQITKINLYKVICHRPSTPPTLVCTKSISSVLISLTSLWFCHFCINCRTAAMGRRGGSGTRLVSLRSLILLNSLLGSAQCAASSCQY